MKAGADPRRDLPRAEEDVRPVVALPRAGLSTAAIAGLAVLAAIILFTVLEGRRRAAQAPSVAPRFADMGSAVVPPPPLFLPPDIRSPAALAIPLGAAPAADIPSPLPQPPTRSVPAPPPPPPPPQFVMPPSPQQFLDLAGAQSRMVQPAGNANPVLVIDNAPGTAPASAIAAGEGGEGAALPASAGGGLAQRAHASLLRNRGTTVAQGTLIPAALETALDSSRPGLVRAIVSRDVRGFDGSRVLIPRGSRLIGEYKSDASPGQKRAMVVWTRLIRPDGAAIAIGSPAGDTLGRGGIKGRVDSHFLERFGGAILQSALDLGVNVATSRIGSSSVIIGIPNSLSGGVGQSIAQPNVAPPTIKVRQGTAITVFVARDLDFTAVEGSR